MLIKTMQIFNMDDANIGNAEDHELSADELKEKGNSCVRNENYNEAVKFHSQTIKVSPKEAILLSNRSLALSYRCQIIC